jgi:hypothetical protein
MEIAYCRARSSDPDRFVEPAKPFADAIFAYLYKAVWRRGTRARSCAELRPRTGR